MKRKLPTRKPLMFMILTACLCLLTSSALAQQYTQAEYNEYQKAIADGPDALVEYIAANPEAVLTKQYAIQQYLQVVNDLYQEGQYAEASEAGSKFLEKVDGENFGALYLTAWSSQLSQQWQKAATVGQKAYKMKPETADLVPLLARAFQNAGQIDQSLPYAEKYCGEAAPKDCWDLLPMITRHYAAQKQWRTAAKYANLTVKAFQEAEKPAGADQKWWDDYSKDEKSLCSGVLGKDAVERKSWATAERHYLTILNSGEKDRNRRAEAYFYIGMSRWNRELIDPAMEAFAKGSWMKGTPHAAPCREQLEKLYKGTHNGSLAGFGEFLDRHKSG